MTATNSKGTILVTGGAGYIGSHTCVELLNGGYEVIAVDNLVNSRRESLARVERIAGKAVTFYEADVRDEAALEGIFGAHRITGVIHFAALKAACTPTSGASRSPREAFPTMRSALTRRASPT